MVYDVYYRTINGKQIKCDEKSGFEDVDDITCPKCGCEKVYWLYPDNIGNGIEWFCKCVDCGHLYKVKRIELYKVIKDEE